MMYAFGLPPPSQTVLAGNVVGRHLSSSSSSTVPVVQVVWIDRNAFKPNRPVSG